MRNLSIFLIFDFYRAPRAPKRYLLWSIPFVSDTFNCRYLLLSIPFVAIPFVVIPFVAISHVAILFVVRMVLRTLKFTLSYLNSTYLLNFFSLMLNTFAFSLSTRATWTPSKPITENTYIGILNTFYPFFPLKVIKQINHIYIYIYVWCFFFFYLS